MRDAIVSHAVRRDVDRGIGLVDRQRGVGRVDGVVAQLAVGIGQRGGDGVAVAPPCAPAPDCFCGTTWMS